MRHAQRAAFALLLTAGVISPTGCGEPAPPSAHTVAARAAAWLWAQQAEDGGWHSETYGLLGSGQSLTPFVLEALLALPPKVAAAPEGAIERAATFILRHTNPDGALGLGDADLHDYPCYATALGVRALERHDATAHAEPIARMRQWLLLQQLADARGWGPVDAAYGAWGMGGEPRRPPEAGHVDLSMTRFVLEALAPLDDRLASVRAVRRAARHFLERLRVRGDDPSTTEGFFFTTVFPDKNKAGPAEGGGYAPYGTANADGLLALLAAGVKPTHAKVHSGLEALVANHRLDRTPGPAPLATSGWADSTVFYYRAASASVFARLGVREAPAGTPWRAALVAALAADQAADGHFTGAANQMKEDDPLIATTLAVRALGHALE